MYNKSSLLTKKSSPSSSSPAISLLTKKSSPSLACSINYSPLSSPAVKSNASKPPKFALNFNQALHALPQPISKPTLTDLNRTHAVIYWVKDDRHQTVSLSTFQNVHSFNDIVEDEEYDVEFVSKASTKAKTSNNAKEIAAHIHRAKVCALGTKVSCESLCTTIVASHVPRAKSPKGKRAKVSKSKQTASNALDENELINQHQTDLFYENHELTNANERLTAKLLEIESLNDVTQSALDASRV